MYRNILIDGNAIGHAHHRANKLNVGGFETQAIYGVIKTIAAIKDTYPEAAILVLWDGKAQWRKEVYPEYKENRKAKTPEEEADKAAYKAQIPILQKALTYLGIRQMLVYSAEADDMAGLMTKRFSEGGYKTLVITGDRDWLQMVSDSVTWHDPIRNYTVTIDNFFEFTGFMTPKAFLQGKALIGDTSDCIAGVNGIGEKTAQELLAAHGSIENFYKKIEAGSYKPKTRKSKTAKSPHPEELLASEEGKRIYNRNMLLMNLLDVPTPPKEEVNVMTPKFDPDTFRKICEKLAFMSILRDFDRFTKQFSGE